MVVFYNIPKSGMTGCCNYAVMHGGAFHVKIKLCKAWFVNSSIIFFYVSTHVFENLRRNLCKIFVNIQAHKMWVLFFSSVLLWKIRTSVFEYNTNIISYQSMSKWVSNVFSSTKLCARVCLTSSKKPEEKSVHIIWCLISQHKVNFFHNDQISIWVFYIVCYKYQQATLLCSFVRILFWWFTFHAQV